MNAQAWEMYLMLVQQISQTFHLIFFIAKSKERNVCAKWFCIEMSVGHSNLKHTHLFLCQVIVLKMQPDSNAVEQNPYDISDREGMSKIWARQWFLMLTLYAFVSPTFITLILFVQFCASLWSTSGWSTLPFTQWAFTS